jgi:hypothetical protein
MTFWLRQRREDNCEAFPLTAAAAFAIIGQPLISGEN